MSLSPFHLNLCLINNLIVKLQPNNAESTKEAISKLISQHGLYAEKSVVKCLVLAIFKDQQEGSVKCPISTVLAHQVTTSIGHPARLTIICEIFSTLNTVTKPNKQLVPQLFRSLNLKAAQEVAICLQILDSGETKAVDKLLDSVHDQAIKKFPQVVKSYLYSDVNDSVLPGGLQDCTPEVLQLILAKLTVDNLGLADNTKALFLKRLQADFPRDIVPVILAPLLYADDTETPLDDMASGEFPHSVMENSPLQVIKDIGYSFTISLERCKEDLKNIILEPTAPVIAQIITMMSNHHSDLQSSCLFLKPGSIWVADIDTYNPVSTEAKTWKPEIFVRALKSVYPNLNWNEIILHLDHPNFVIKDKQAFKVLFGFLRCGLLNSGVAAALFPVKLLYRLWQNREGQATLVWHLVNSSDVFSVADHPLNPLPLDNLKHYYDKKDLIWWSSNSLTQLIVDLIECGQKTLIELLKIPMQSCPDLLVLALLKLRDPMVPIVQDLFPKIIPMFFADHPNSLPILQSVWNFEKLNLKRMILYLMVEWYSEDTVDNLRLSRVLELSQHLNVLPALLNFKEFPFSIDLACLASRRQYVNLDKWLLNKIMENGEPFVSAIALYLQRSCAQIINDQRHKPCHLPIEILNTLMSHLVKNPQMVQADIGQLMSHLNSTIFLINTRSRPHEPHQTIASSAAPYQTFNPSPVADPVANLTPRFAMMNTGTPSQPHSFAVPPPQPPSELMQSVNSVVPAVPSRHVPPTNLTLQQFSRQPDEGRAHFRQMCQGASLEVQTECSGYLESLIKTCSSQSIERVISLLVRCRTSTVQHEQHLYYYMLHCLFDEYLFLQQFPGRELAALAQLMCGLLENNALPEQGKWLVLIGVYQALQTPFTSNVFKSFGVVSLDHLKDGLKNLPVFCDCIKNLPFYKEIPAHLREIIETISGDVSQPVTTFVSSSNSISESSRSASVPPSEVKILSVANATNIDTLLTAIKQDKINLPPEAIQDKTIFIFNNLSLMNVALKAEEMKQMMVSEYRPWLSRYMVVKRVSIEPKFHTLYMQFLDKLDLPDMFVMILDETYSNIKVLLVCDKRIDNFSDRSLLKNLGRWLGMLTLGRNKPILHIEIDLKGLLLEAFHLGQQELMYIIPFVAKILESCQESKVFKPPNPWTMALMRVLAELHLEQDMKTNLRFEIEVLCKTLKVDLAELNPGDYLKDKERLKTMPSQLTKAKKHSTTNGVKDEEQATAKVKAEPADDDLVVEMPTDVGQLVDADSTSLDLTPSHRYKYSQVGIESLPQLVQHDSSGALCSMFPNVTEFVAPTIHKAITEWITNFYGKTEDDLVTLCVKIVRRDFLHKTDVKLMQTAACNMVRHVICGHVSATCKPAVIDAVCRRLCSVFADALAPLLPQAEVIESTAAMITDSNAELITAVAAKAAAERTIKSVQQRLLPDYLMRHEAMAEEQSMFTADPAATTYDLPQRLSGSSTPSCDERMIAYGDMGCKIPGFVPTSMSPESSQADLNVESFKQPKPIIQAPALPSSQITSKKLDDVMPFLREANVFVSRYLDHPLLKMQAENMSNVLKVAMQNITGNGNCMSLLVQKVFQGLLQGYGSIYSVSNSDLPVVMLYRNIIINILRRMQVAFELNNDVLIGEVTRLLIECPEPLRYNVEAISYLMGQKLIHLPEYDCGLVLMVEGGKNLIAVNFVAKLLDKLQSLRSESGAKFVNLPNTRMVLELINNQNSFQSNSTTDPLIIFSQLENSELSTAMYSGILIAKDPVQLDPPTILHTDAILNIWVDMLHGIYSAAELKEFEHFETIQQHMMSQGFLSSEDATIRFMRAGIQLCYEDAYCLLKDESGLKMESPTGKHKYYAKPDALAKLVAYVVRNMGLVDNPPKVRLLYKFLGIIIGTILTQECYLSSFNPLTYHRILLGLLLDVRFFNPSHIKQYYGEVILAFSYMLHLLRPTISPEYFFYWMEFFGHREFIKNMLNAPGPYKIKTYSMYYILLVDCLQYTTSTIGNMVASKERTIIEAGVLRILLVLLHDFPSFMTLYRTGLLDEVPLGCHQIRNMLMSSMPTVINAPPLTTYDLNPRQNADLSKDPTLLVNYENNIQPAKFKKDLDIYLNTRSPASFLLELRQYLMVSNTPGTHYSMRLMNALVLHAAAKGIASVKAQQMELSMTTVSHSPSMDVLQNVVVQLDDEGRYCFLSAMVGQLTYPNSHTYYFRCVLLHFFTETRMITLRELICRCLLERLLVKARQPWGIIYCLGSVVSNTAYRFWDLPFIKDIPEIRKLIEDGLKSNPWYIEPQKSILK